MFLPKIIHFIWAGGEKLLPNRSVESIKSWAESVQEDPLCKIYLWVDQKTTSSTFLYKQEEEFFKNEKNIEIQDVEIFREASQYIAYELDRLRSNYGASSDMLRYKILYEYGGAYFDSDIYPGKVSLLERNCSPPLNENIF